MINTDITLNELNTMGKGTMGEHLGMEFIAVEEDKIVATMPVDHRTVQPYGLLHGGASVALAETLGSVAAHLSVDSSKYQTVGLEINANHIRSVRSGKVTGTATPVHIGKSTHVWAINIVDERGKLVCTSRITMAIIKKLNND
ncbi:MAG: hotdog fold thioesterase [Bacteroidota bacterium]